MDLLGWLTGRIHRDAPKQVNRNKKRSYHGAMSSRLYADFLSPNTSANSELENNIVTLRNRARELCRNNSYAKRYLESLCVGVLGENGFSFQCKARQASRPDQVTGDLDVIGNGRVEQAFKRWSEKVTADGKHSLYDVYRLCLQAVARDGEILLKKVYGSEYKDGYSLQLLEADFLDERYTKILPNGNRVIMGVEVDQYDKPVAYHLRKRPQNGHPNENNYYHDRTRIEASEIYHLFLPERPSAVRACTWFAPVMGRLHMLDTYENAELVAAKVSAQKLGFIVSPDGDGFIGDDEDEGDQILNSEAGSIQQLPAGFSFQEWNPEHPVSAFAEFHKAVLRGVSSGLNISFHSLSNNLESVNYSSIRQGSIEERDHFKMIQKFLINHLAIPIARDWLKSWMSFNSSSLPIRTYEKFANSIIFYGRGFQWIDPQKEINSEQMAISLGIKTRNDVALQHGRDIEEIFAQIQNEKKLAEKYGIVLGDEPFGSPHMPVNPKGFEDQSQNEE